jgi:nucleoside-diphosphate-sugar epimerase
MSSGAVYGKYFQNPVTEKSCLLNGVTEISPEDFYAVAKLNAEAKHRSFDQSNIVDLRIFSYISKFIDLNSNFLVSEIMKAIKNNQTFMTNDQNISRDYLHPDDMMQIINLVIKKWKEVGFINDTFDTYSRNPVTKMDMLKSLAEKYNLQYEIEDKANIDSSATGFKMNYYSVNRKLKNLGYEPRYSSLESILKVFSEVL